MSFPSAIVYIDIGLGQALLRQCTVAVQTVARLGMHLFLAKTAFSSAAGREKKFHFKLVVFASNQSLQSTNMKVKVL